MSFPPVEFIPQPEFLYDIREGSVEGWPGGITLTYRSNRQDRKPRRVSVAVVEHLEGLDRQIPAAFEVIEPERSAAAALRLPRFATIRVVAAPGVSVRLDGFPDVYVPDLNYPRVEIFRVQDPALVPPMASNIQPNDYEWSYPFPDDEQTDFLFDEGGLRSPWNRLRVTSLADGVAFNHPATASSLFVLV